MAGFNPIEWIAWVYGRFFLNHPYRGGTLFAILGAALALLLWSRGIDKYREEHSPKQEATTDSEPSRTVVAQGSERTNLIQPESPEKAGHRTTDAEKQPIPKTTRSNQLAPTPPRSVQQSNSGGTNLQQVTTGDNSPIINSPITITETPPLPNVKWTLDRLPPGDGKKPGTMAHVSVDRSFPNAAFSALCDRPCTSVVAVVPTAGFTDSAGAFSKSNPNLVRIKLDLPPSVAAGETVNWEIRSKDDEDVTVISVEAFRRQ